MNRILVDFGVQCFQLRYVHRVGVCQTCGEVGDLSCFIRRADRDSAVSGFPCRCGLSGCFSRERIIAGHFRSGTCYGTGTQSHAAVLADVGVIAEDGDVRCFGFRFRFLRADNDVSVDIFQLVVVAHDEVMTRVGDGVSVARHDVVGHSRLAVRTGNVVAYTGNLRINSVCYQVTVAVDADMASAFLEETARVSTVRRIKEIPLFLFIFVGQRFVIIRVMHKVARTTDRCAVGLLYSVHVPDNFIFPASIFRSLGENGVI